jgi:hypothetical protein
LILERTGRGWPVFADQLFHDGSGRFDAGAKRRAGAEHQDKLLSAGFLVANELGEAADSFEHIFHPDCRRREATPVARRIWRLSGS